MASGATACFDAGCAEAIESQRIRIKTAPQHFVTIRIGLNDSFIVRTEADCGMPQPARVMVATGFNLP